jgi:predicted nucleic acid-binding protein
MIILDTNVICELMRPEPIATRNGDLTDCGVPVINPWIASAV